MMSLRSLIRALVAALLALLGIRSTGAVAARVAYGPSGPSMIQHVVAARVRAAAPALHLRPHHARPRPARVAPPPHILALLAAAPDVEPEFTRAAHPTVLEPIRLCLRAAAARVRVFNPTSTPESPRRPARSFGRPLALRLSRACTAVSEHLVWDGPPPRASRS